MAVTKKAQTAWNLGNKYCNTNENGRFNIVSVMLDAIYPTSYEEAVSSVDDDEKEEGEPCTLYAGMYMGELVDGRRPENVLILAKKLKTAEDFMARVHQKPGNLYIVTKFQTEQLFEAGICNETQMYRMFVK